MSENDPVNSPSHYSQGDIEPIEAIEDWKLGFNLGNAVKYIARAGKKDPAKTVEDLKKSRYYLNREITNLSLGEEDFSETCLDKIEDLSDQTGFSKDDVLNTALWLYDEAIQAKRQGKHVGVVDNHGNIVGEWVDLYEGDVKPEEEDEGEEPGFELGDRVRHKVDGRRGVVVPDSKCPRNWTIQWNGEEEADNGYHRSVLDHDYMDDFEPNEETLQAIKDVDAGVGVERYADAAEMLDALSTDPEPFKPGDQVVRAENDGQSGVAVGTIKRALHANSVYIVDWMTDDGTKWSGEYPRHGLIAYKPEAADPEPDPEPFKVGDQVQFQIDDQPSPATGVVKRVLYGKPVYLVDWKESDGAEWESEHWLHELKTANPVSGKDEAKPDDQSKTVTCYRCAKCCMPIVAGFERGKEITDGLTAMYHFGCFPDKATKPEPKFKPGDMVRTIGAGHLALVYESSMDAHGDECLRVFWAEDATRGFLKAEHAVRCDD